jgi:serine beta-lactamase-like protein LACTB, mitochondrial
MARKGIEKWLVFGVLALGLIPTAMLALWGYLSATARPLHPDPRAVTSVAAPASPRWSSAVARAQTLARETLIEQNWPGLSVAVGLDGEIVWAEGFGAADLGTHELDFTGQLALGSLPPSDKRVVVGPGTRFRIVGVSMALTSAAVGLLLEKQQLKLDADIRTYVPAFPAKQWPVTLRQLMSHQGGIENDGGDEAPLTSQCETTVDGLKLDGFAEHDLLFEPGTRQHYSTYGWVLVSAAIEAAAHEPFFSFMRSKIFEPLGMRDTRPESWREPIANRATSYFPRFAGDTRYGPDLAREGDHVCFAGGGAFLSTPSDLVRFSMDLNSGKLLQPSTVATLQTPQRLASGVEATSGLGWTLETVQLGGQPVRVVRQDDLRSIGGATSLLTFPERGLVVAVMSNITFAETQILALKIAEMFGN